MKGLWRIERTGLRRAPIVKRYSRYKSAFFRWKNVITFPSHITFSWIRRIYNYTGQEKIRSCVTHFQRMNWHNWLITALHNTCIHVTYVSKLQKQLAKSRYIQITLKTASTIQSGWFKRNYSSKAATRLKRIPFGSQRKKSCRPLQQLNASFCNKFLLNSFLSFSKQTYRPRSTKPFRATSPATFIIAIALYTTSPKTKPLSPKKMTRPSTRAKLLNHKISRCYTLPALFLTIPRQNKRSFTLAWLAASIRSLSPRTLSRCSRSKYTCSGREKEGKKAECLTNAPCVCLSVLRRAGGH